MDFGEVLSKSWKIIWKNKILWLFGILASCSSGTPPSNPGNQTQYNFDSRDFNVLPPDVQAFFNNIASFFAQNPWVIILVLAFALILFLVIVFLTTIGRIGLIRGASRADDGARLNFGDLFNDSLRYFWRVFLLNLLAGIIIALALFIFFALAAAGIALTLGIALICLIPLLCLLVPFTWFINGVLMMASTAIVVEDVDIIEGLRRGWNVVIKDLGAIIVMALIIYIGGGILAFLVSLPFMAAFIPLFIGVVNETATGLREGAAVTALLACILFPIMLVLKGILTAYTSTLWTLTYRRLTGRRPGAGATVAPVVVDAPSSGAAVYETPGDQTITDTGPGGDGEAVP
jgi:hypothetical protein